MLPKFEPNAGMQYVIRANHDAPLPKTGQYGAYWMYEIDWWLAQNPDIITKSMWFLNEHQEKMLREGGMTATGYVGVLSVGQARNKDGKPYNTFDFQLQGGQQTPAQDKPQPEKDKPYPTTEIPAHDPIEEFDKEKRLMKWCIDTLWELWPEPLSVADAENRNTIGLIPLIQSLHVHLRGKGIYPEPEEKTTEEKFEEDNQPIPGAQNIHNQEPPPQTDEDAPV